MYGFHLNMSRISILLCLLFAYHGQDINAADFTQCENTRARQSNIPSVDYQFRKSLENYGIGFSPVAKWTDRESVTYTSRGPFVPVCGLRSADGEFAVRIIVPYIYDSADSAKEAYGKRPYSYKVFYDWNMPERHITVPPTDLTLLSPDMRHRRSMSGDSPQDVNVHTRAQAGKWFNADSLIVYTPANATTTAPAATEGMHYTHTRVAMIQKQGRGYVRMETRSTTIVPLSSYHAIDTGSAKEWFNADSALYLKDHVTALQRFYLSEESAGGDLRYSPLERLYPFCDVWLIYKNGFAMRMYLFGKKRLTTYPEPLRGSIFF